MQLASPQQHGLPLGKFPHPVTRKLTDQIQHNVHSSYSRSQQRERPQQEHDPFTPVDVLSETKFTFIAKDFLLFREE